jgi:hypothetical protein
MKKYLKKDQTGLYLMAKESYHLLGEVTRDEWDLAIVFKEDNKNFYGNWVFGYGLVDVRFPKDKVKKLNKKEITKYNEIGYGINGVFINMLKVKDYLWKKL